MKAQNLKPCWNTKVFFLSFSHWRVKGISSNRIALKIDVTRPESVRFAGASVPHSARIFYRLWAVKGLTVPDAILSPYGLRLSVYNCWGKLRSERARTTNCNLATRLVVHQPSLDVWIVSRRYTTSPWKARRPCTCRWSSPPEGWVGAGVMTVSTPDPQKSMHSSSESKRLSLPSQPVYTKRWQRWSDES